MAVETEIKLPIDDLAVLRTQLRRFGWRVASHRRLERNWLFDREDGSLKRSGRMLRVRRAGTAGWLTFKGPSAQGTAHKIRNEFEIETADADSLFEILGALDFRVAWRYEKYRSEFAKSGEPGKILLDETPLGNFLELEGAAAWIDATAGLLGFRPADYVTLSYRGLFEKLGEKNHIGPDMVFEPSFHE